MRENRLYGSEGGEVKSLPYPYQPWRRNPRLARLGAARSVRAAANPAGRVQAAPAGLLRRKGSSQ